jgi:hypothetical protein
MTIDFYYKSQILQRFLLLQHPSITYSPLKTRTNTEVPPASAQEPAEIFHDV